MLTAASRGFPQKLWRQDDSSNIGAETGSSGTYCKPSWQSLNVSNISTSLNTQAIIQSSFSLPERRASAPMLEDLRLENIQLPGLFLPFDIVPQGFPPFVTLNSPTSAFLPISSNASEITPRIDTYLTSPFFIIALFKHGGRNCWPCRCHHSANFEYPPTLLIGMVRSAALTPTATYHRPPLVDSTHIYS